MTLREISTDLKFILCSLIVLGFVAWIADLEKEVADQVKAWKERDARIERILDK